MRLTDIGVVEKNRLAAVYRERGVVVVPGVTLPVGFEPRSAEFAFLARGQQCEVHIASNTMYFGADPQWRACQAQPEGPGRTRLVGTVRGDFFSGVNLAVAMLDQAASGEEEPWSEEASSGDVAQPAERAEAEADSRECRWLRNLVEEGDMDAATVVGRDREMLALKTGLLRQNKPGVVLLGMPGVGKTALVEKLAQEIARDDDLPGSLRRLPIYELPLGRLREGARFAGDVERLARSLLEEPGRPVFFLDEIHQLSHPDLSPLCDLVKPALAAGSLRVIGATTPVEWRRIVDLAFKRRFLEIQIPEPLPEEAFGMVRARARELSEHHRLEIPDSLVREAVMLAVRFLPNRFLPDKAIDLLDQAAAMQLADGPEADSSRRVKADEQDDARIPLPSDLSAVGSWSRPARSGRLREGD